MADITKTLKDSAYVAVGLGVIAFQKAQVRRVELQKQVTSQINDTREQINKLVDEVEKRVEPVLDQIEGRLPSQAQSIVKQARSTAKDARGQVNGLVNRASSAA
jgi:F0F1-type ATP synthase membrane subunit b/b'